MPVIAGAESSTAVPFKKSGTTSASVLAGAAGGGVGRGGAAGLGWNDYEKAGADVYFYSSASSSSRKVGAFFVFLYGLLFTTGFAMDAETSGWAVRVALGLLKSIGSSKPIDSCAAAWKVPPSSISLVSVAKGYCACWAWAASLAAFSAASFSIFFLFHGGTLPAALPAWMAAKSIWACRSATDCCRS